MIGLPVIALTDSAAPPRASPSSFDEDHAVEVGRLGELLGHVDRVLAGHGVDHQQHVVRLGALLDLGELLHQLLVHVQAPAVSTISTSRRSCFAWSSAHSAMSTGSRPVPCS